MKVVGVKKRLQNIDLSWIMEHWNSFFQDWHAQNLWVSGQEIIAVYSNYDSDEKRAYDLLIGRQWEQKEWYEIIDIAPTLYKEYVPKGSGPENMWKVWEVIWNDKSITRAFDTDYEVFTGDIQNPQVSIFIGIK